MGMIRKSRFNLKTTWFGFRSTRTLSPVAFAVSGACANDLSDADSEMIKAGLLLAIPVHEGKPV